MSERERWIVYPLLFFALGAAIRDKLFHQVETKQLACSELTAKTIACEEILVYGPEGEARPLAQLSSMPVPGSKPGAPSRRVGRLLLTDSDGQEFFGLADDELKMRRLACESISIIDEQGPGRRVASLSVQPFSFGDPPQVHRVGVLELNGKGHVVLPDIKLSEPPSAPSAERDPAPAAAAAQGPEPGTGEPTPSSTEPELAPPPTGEPTPADLEEDAATPEN